MNGVQELDAVHTDVPNGRLSCVFLSVVFLPLRFVVLLTCT